MTRPELIAAVGGHLHSEQLIDGARLIAEFSKANPKSIDSRDVALEWANSLLFSLLNENKYADAASLLWGHSLFDPRPRATQRVWGGIARSNSLMLMGAASQSKSYSAGVWLMLDWIRDPHYTSVNLVGPSEDHLKDNLFSHLVALHNQSTLPLPGFIGDLFIGLDSKNRRGAIRGVVIPLGKRPSGRLQGRKRVPRKVAHPTLGAMSRIRFFLDEVEKIPGGVWKDVDNIFSNLGGDVDGFKILCAFNPEDQTGPVAQRCEPVGGWEGFNKETDHEWKSKRGWDVVRLDAKFSENVVEKREVYPGLQTYEGYNRIIQNAGGENTPGADTMARACFPSSGAIYSVMPSILLAKLKAQYIFIESPEACAGIDLALEGKDTAELCHGRFGRAVGVRYRPTYGSSAGKEILFADRTGKRVFKWAAQADDIFPLTRGDTVAMAERIRKDCVRLHILPGHVMLDRTGNGAGVHDYLKSLWSGEVRGINYSESATEKKILVEDTKNAKEEYGRAVSELWFGLKKWGEFGFVKIDPDALTEELALELTGRRYAPGKNTQVETKKEYMSRGNSSPNKADALTLWLFGIRMFSGVIPSSAEDMEGTTTGHFDATNRGPVPVFVDSTNVCETLQESGDNFYMD
jgi:hypothetical protein